MAHRRLLAITVGFVTAVTSACYDSEVPLDPTPMKELDLALVGTWRCLGSPARADADPATFVVAKARDRVYSVAFIEEDRAPERYEAYSSLVAGVTLLNVHDLDPRFPTTPWTFARYSFLEPDVLHVWILDEALLKEFVAPTPAALRAEVERHIGNERLFTDYCVCLRATEAKKGA